MRLLPFESQSVESSSPYLMVCYYPDEFILIHHSCQRSADPIECCWAMELCIGMPCKSVIVAKIQTIHSLVHAQSFGRCSAECHATPVIGYHRQIV